MRRPGAVCFLALAIGLPSAAADAVRLDEHSPLPTCTKDALPPAVNDLIKPVLLARLQAARSSNESDASFEEAFYALLAAKGKVALEAKVALMAYYTGEHYGEELLESVLKKPGYADSLVLRYSACRPRTAFEDQLDGVLVLKSLYNIYEGQRVQRK